MQQVIFDSSFLMAVADRPTTWYEDMVEGMGRFQPVLPDCVRSELERLAEGEGRRSRTARVAISIASGFQTVSCGGTRVDDEIASAAASTGASVATTDDQLARTLRASKVKVISLSRGRVAFG